MSELLTLARPYSIAVFKLAQQHQQTQVWSEMLQLLAFVVQDSQIQLLINNPKISKSKLIQLFLEITQGHFTEQGQNLLKLLISHNRLILAPQISILYEQHKAQVEGYIEVNVQTAYPFSDSEANSFKLSLEKRWAKTVHMNVSIEPSLIGGFRIKAGDQVIDGSIKGRLQQLAKRL
ncbi:MAG: hypothetical protein RL637_233 [Pseudomonadota bacterium]|jgi:F-type H+-transporting ATPase subunit delta